MDITLNIILPANDVIWFALSALPVIVLVKFAITFTPTIG